MAGLLQALGGAAKYGLKQEERRQDERADERKAKMRIELEKQLWEAKTQYSKANPQYNKFLEDPVTGNVTGIDEHGGSKLLMEASPEARALREKERSLKDRSAEADIGYKEAQAAYQKENAASLSAYRAALAERPRPAPNSNTKTPLTTTELKAKAAKAVLAANPAWKEYTPEQGDPDYADYQDALATALAELQAVQGGAAPPSMEDVGDDPFGNF